MINDSRKGDIGIDSLAAVIGIPVDKTAYRITTQEAYEKIRQTGFLRPSSTLDSGFHKIATKYVFAFPGKCGLKKWFEISSDTSTVHQLVASGLILNALRGGDPFNGLVLGFPIPPVAEIADYFYLTRKGGSAKIELEHLASIIPFERYVGNYTLPELLMQQPLESLNITLAGTVRLTMSQKGFAYEFSALQS